MKKTTTTQRGKSLFAPAEFDSAFTHFFEHENCGLMLVPVPTGVGKTTQAKFYIYNHYQDKTFFYVTPLNKNVKKAFEETRKLFEDAHLLEEFDKRAIYLQSNLDMFEEHIDFVKEQLDEKITSLTSFKKLVRKPHSEKLDSDEKEEKARLESQFRSELHNLLIEEFKTRIPKELIHRISDSETFRPLLFLYPSIKSCEKNIFFLSVDKLYVGNTPIVETHYDFVRNKMMDGAVVFLDEFDSTKEKLLGKMIDEAAEDAIDLPQLFRDINDKIRGDAPSIDKDMLLDIPGKPTNKTSKYAFETTQSVFVDRVNKYHLDRKFRYDGKAESQYFILSDWSTPVVAELGKKDSPNLYVTYDAISQKNLITEEKGTLKLTNVFRPLSGAIEYFVNALKLISGNEYEYRRENRVGEVITIYDCVDSVLDNFDFKPYEANWNYVSPLINNKLRNKDNNIRKNKFEIEFYSSGFDFVSITNNVQTAHSSKIDCISLHSTPEDYLAQLAQKAHVVGLSATADFQTVTGNYDLDYLKRKLNHLFYKIPAEDQTIIDSYIQKRLSENNSTPIPIEISVENNDFYGFDEIFKDRDDARHYASELERIESSVKSDDQSVDSYKNNCKRFLKILIAILRFIDNTDGKVILVLSNRNVGTGAHTIEKYRYFCKEAGRDVSNVEFISLSSKTWESDMNSYKKAIADGKRVVLFTCYQAASTGQNLQFMEMLEELGKERERDIDSIYVEYPTNQIVKNRHNLPKDQKIEAIYQVEALSEAGMLSKKERRPLIKSYLSGFTSGFQNSMYNCKSTNMHILKTLCQAIGRVSRTSEKEGKAFVYIDEDIVKKVDVSLLRGKVFTKEFGAFLDYVHSCRNEKAVTSSEDDERINIAENMNDKSGQMIYEFLGDWADFDESEMYAWTALREFSAIHPVANSDLFTNYPNYRRFYLEQPTSGPINAYYYSGSDDYIDSISYTKTNDIYYQVSDENSCLDYLNKNPILSNVFKSKNIPVKWEKGEYIILPTIYRNIYKGAIGECCVKALLEKHGIMLSTIDDPRKFERFDYVISGREDIGIDAKFWSLSSASATSDDLTKEVEVEKILKKMEETEFAKGIIVNILCKNADKALRRPHKEGEGKLLVIPSLIDPDSDDASVDLEALNAIFEFVEDK